jgi:hypothetical protein
VPRYESSLVSFHSQLFQLSHHLSCPLVIPLSLPLLPVSIASISWVFIESIKRTHTGHGVGAHKTSISCTNMLSKYIK